MEITHKLRFAGLLMAGAVAITGNQAMAGGFAVREQSASGLGMAFAGSAAGYDDLSSMFFNPATMIRNEGFNAQAEASLILPSSKISVTSGGANSGNIGVAAIVPSTYVAYSVNPDFVFGVGVNAPFGLVTKSDIGWGGQGHGVKSALKVINVNPMVAYRLSPMISVGAGIQMDYMEVTLTSVSGIVGPVTVTGDDKVSFGFTAGILFEPTKSTRIGIGYRSQIKHNLKGDMTAITKAPITAKFTSPESVTASFHQDINPQWSIKGSVEWMNWSRFKNLTIVGHPVTGTANTVQLWNDSWFFSAGAEFKPTPTMVLRAGAAYELSPVPDATRTPRIPDNDRIWLTVGGGMKVTDRISVNASYAHIFVKKAPINLVGPVLTATTKTHLDIFSVSAKLSF